MPAAAQDGMKRVTKRALESAARETTIRFHVSDHWLDRAASAQVALKRRGHPASRAGDVDGGGFNIVTTIAAIHECPFWAGVSQDFHLLQRLAQRVPITRVPGHRSHADNKALLMSRRHRHLRSELVAHPRLALGDAIHLRLMQRVELALVLQLLAQQPVHKRDLHLDPLPKAVVRHSAQLALDVPHHADSIALQPPQHLAHPLELPRMGIAPDLTRQTRREPRVTLAKRQVRSFSERHQTPTGLLVKPRIRGMGDCLFHHRGVHDHRLDAAFRDHPGPAARLDRLGQQPLDALLANPFTPPRQRRGAEREAVLKERLATIMLVVRVLHPPRDHGHFRQPIGVLQVKQPRHQTRRRRRSSSMRREKPSPFRLEELPVDQRPQLYQLMTHIDHVGHVGQKRTQEIAPFRAARFRLHRSIRNCTVLALSLPNPATRWSSDLFRPDSLNRGLKDALAGDERLPQDHT